MRTLYTTLFLLVLLASASYAQQAPRPTTGVVVSGVVIDSVDKTELVGASVLLMRLSDSLRVGAFANNKGQFVFRGVPPGRYRITISYLGYRPQRQFISVGQQAVILSPVMMSAADVTTQEVEIVERVPPATMKQDTAQFNADAYKVNKDATAEDLVKKMPGMEVDNNGQVRAQGENVTRVLVDGQPFFDNDPSAALRNLPAEMVDRVQVYDDPGDQARFTGFNTGNTSRTVNIITRPDRRQGNFGRVQAGYGTNDRYMASSTVNNFKGDSRLTLLGQSNNTNQQNFALEDILGGQAFGGGAGGAGNAMMRMGGGRAPIGGGGGQFQRLGGGGGGQGGPGMGAAGDFLTSQANGISTTHAVGLNYTDNWGKYFKFTGSYFYNNNDNRNDQSLLRNYALGDNRQVYDERTLAASVTNTHRINTRLEINVDSMNAFIITGRATLQGTLAGNTVNAGTQQNLSVLNQSMNRYVANGDGYTLNGSLLYRHRFAKRGRTISLNLGAGTNQSSNDYTLLAENQYYQPAFVIDSLWQQNVGRQRGSNYSANATYTEPISQTLQAEISYQANARNTRSARENTNILPGDPAFGLLDTALSNTLTSKTTTQQAGAGLRWQRGRHQITARVNYSYTTLDNDQFFPEQAELNQPFYNILPSFSYQYSTGRSRNFRLVYNVNPQLPTATQLQPVVDLSNPLQPSAGNPNLRQSLTHTVFGRYSAVNTQNLGFFNLFVFAMFTEDFVANTTRILTSAETLPNGLTLQPGSQLTQPTNLQGYMSVRAFSIYSRPIKKIKSNLNLSANASYVRTPGQLNGLDNIANNYSGGVGVSLTSNISEKIDFTVSSNPTVGYVRNTRSATADNSYQNLRNSIRLDYRFAKHYLLQTDLSHSQYLGYSAGFNQSFVLWNVAFGRKLFARQQGEIKVFVYDALRQNTDIRRNVTETYVEDATSTVLRQYFMLQFIYTFRNFRANGQAPAGGGPVGR